MNQVTLNVKYVQIETCDRTEYPDIIYITLDEESALSVSSISPTLKLETRHGYGEEFAKKLGFIVNSVIVNDLM
jgi:hypothetical protein